MADRARGLSNGVDAEAPAGERKGGPVVLPSLPETRRWLEQTRTQRDALQARADALREKIKPLREELLGVERSIKVLDHFLGQVSVAIRSNGAEDGSDPPAAGKRRGAALDPGVWSRSFPACRSCGTTEKTPGHRHKAGGFCARCYDRPARRIPKPGPPGVAEGAS